LSLPNLHDLTLKGIWKKVDPIRNEINQQRGTADQILTWIEQKKLDEFRALDGLASVASLFAGIDQISETQSFLAAFQLARLYADDAKSLKQYGERINYQRSKKTFIGLLENVNSNPAWISVGVSENKGQLIASFPAATDMSNGQRDLLSFVAQLLKALYSLTGDRAILIIDEVFDYLDEANLLAAQFFATRLIEAFKSRGAEIFPLILTHLDPLVFRHSILGLGRGDMRKVHFLAKADDKSRTLGIAAMVKKREDAVLKPLIGKYFFHYHPQSSDQK
jgi:hypothetical protein